MSIEVRAAESDADLEAFIHIRRTLFPNESAGSVELFRELAASPDRRLLVAELDGEVVGQRSRRPLEQPRRPRSSCRGSRAHACARRGVGTALLRALVGHALQMECDRLTLVDGNDGGARPFARAVRLSRDRSPGRAGAHARADGAGCLTAAGRRRGRDDRGAPRAARGSYRARAPRATTTWRSMAPSSSRDRGLASRRGDAPRGLVRRARRRRDRRLLRPDAHDNRGRRRGRAHGRPA